MLFLMGVAILGLFAAIIMTVYDCTHGKLLHGSHPPAVYPTFVTHHRV